MNQKSGDTKRIWFRKRCNPRGIQLTPARVPLRGTGSRTPPFFVSMFPIPPRLDNATAAGSYEPRPKVAGEPHDRVKSGLRSPRPRPAPTRRHAHLHTPIGPLAA